MVFIIIYGTIILFFIVILKRISKIQKRTIIDFKSKQNELSLQKYNSPNYKNVFNYNYQKIVSPLKGFIKKEYLMLYLKNNSLRKKQNGLLVKIIPKQGNISETIAAKCGEIINIEFNGDSIPACEISDTEPHYIFWIYIENMNKENGEIFVINAVKRLIDLTGIEFNFTMKNF